MSVLKRALIQVRGNLGKSILIFIIFLMTMGLVVTALMATTIYNKTLDQTFIDGTVPLYVTPAYSTSLFGTGGGYDESMMITAQQYLDFVNLESVESSDISLSSILNSGQLELPSQAGVYSTDVMYTSKPEMITKYYGSDVYQLDYDQEAFKTDPNTVIVNDEVLALNDLQVGDTITLNLNPESAEGQANAKFADRELTIIGSYNVTPTSKMLEIQGDQAGDQPDLSFDYLKTTVIIPMSIGDEVLNAYQNEPDVLTPTATYYVQTLEDKDKFASEVEAIVGEEVKVGFDLSDSSENKMASGLAMISSFKEALNYLLSGLVVIIVVLLTVIITMFIRGRKNEIGIMVALGETKRNIYAQLLIEQSIILVASIAAVYPIAYIGANIGANNYGFLKLGFTIVPFVQSLIIGIVIIGLITIIPAIYTLRLKPKKILL